MRDNRLIGRLSPGWCIGLCLLPVCMALAALCIGRMQISPGAVLRSVWGHLTGGTLLSDQLEKVLWNMRLPRILMAGLVGAALSAAGCVFQSLFSNPLATPDTLGVASGASFGAALALLFGLGLVWVQAISLLFGLLAVLLTWLSVTGRGKHLSSMVLAGIMIGSLFNALLSFVKFTADTETKLPAITYWLMGSFEAAGYVSLRLGAPVILLSLAVLLLLRWRLNVLPLSEDEARSTGVNLRALRITAILCATAMTAAGISMCGQVGWVGLLVPHICRMKFGNNHLSLLPASILTGAAFLILVDTAARSMTASEIPVSILTAIVGAPFFVLLMRRTGGWQL